MGSKALGMFTRTEFEQIFAYREIFEQEEAVYPLAYIDLIGIQQNLGLTHDQIMHFAILYANLDETLLLSSSCTHLC